MKTLSIFTIFIFLVTSCAKNKAEEQAIKDDNIIIEYLSKNNLKATKTTSGLYYYIENEGNSVKPNQNSQVRVSYKGYLTNGVIFDESDSLGVVFYLNQVIEGWTEGICYFDEGGKGKLFIPSALGYGSKSTSEIPANSVLIFDVNLKDVY